MGPWAEHRIIREKPRLCTPFLKTGSASENLVRRFTPGAQIEPVQDEAEQIGWDEAELFGVERDHADDHTVDTGQNPSFPIPLANQDC
jgi:hypothetical protein